MLDHLQQMKCCRIMITRINMSGVVSKACDVLLHSSTQIQMYVYPAAGAEADGRLGLCSMRRHK
jgi:hypothetical protein